LHLHTCEHIFFSSSYLLSPPPPYIGTPPAPAPCRTFMQKRKEKKITFLLVCDKSSYTGNFLVIFPCIYVMQQQLVHLLYFSSFLP
jgi:hypothetical protein